MPHDRLWKPGPHTHVLRTEHAHATTSQTSVKQSAPGAAAHSVDTALGWQGATSTEHAHATTSRGSLRQTAPEAAVHSVNTLCLLNRLTRRFTARGWVPAQLGVWIPKDSGGRQAHSRRSLVVVAAEDIEASRKETLGASSGSRRR